MLIQPKPPQERFRVFSQWISKASASPYAFSFCVILVLAWAVTGPIFHYSDTWLLAINTPTTVITFLMVFLIQNTQNRDAKAIHLKLDELLRGVGGARTSLMGLESLGDEEMRALREQHAKMRAAEIASPGARAPVPAPRRD